MIVPGLPSQYYHSHSLLDQYAFFHGKEMGETFVCEPGAHESVFHTEALS